MKRYQKAIQIPIAILFWIGVWWFSSYIKGLPLLFPTPWKVFLTLGELFRTSSFYLTILSSIGRILIGILCALICGILFSALSHRFSFARTLLLPLMTVIKTTPVASFIILFMLWIGSSAVPALITFLMVVPVVWTNLDVGLSRMDKQLVELTKVYQFRFFRKLKTLIFPSVFPYFVSACRSSLGLAWKAGISAEILTMPTVGIGTEIGVAKLYINTEEMFAWTLTVILISLLIEFGFVKLMNLIPVFHEEKEVVKE